MSASYVQGHDILTLAICSPSVLKGMVLSILWYFAVLIELSHKLGDQLVPDKWSWKILIRKTCLGLKGEGQTPPPEPSVSMSLKNMWQFTNTMYTIKKPSLHLSREIWSICGVKMAL